MPGSCFSYIKVNNLLCSKLISEILKHSITEIKLITNQRSTLMGIENGIHIRVFGGSLTRKKLMLSYDHRGSKLIVCQKHVFQYKYKLVVNKIKLS